MHRDEPIYQFIFSNHTQRNSNVITKATLSTQYICYFLNKMLQEKNGNFTNNFQ